MKAQLESIYNSAKADIEGAKSISDLDEVRLKYLSRKGEFNSIKKGLKDLTDEEKRTVGAFANQITEELENLIQDKHNLFYEKELSEKLEKDRIDITLDGKFTPLGKVHPLTQTTNEIVSIFRNLGFSVASSELSPEVETEYYNFDMLNVPKDHPARDVQDTFYANIAKNVVLNKLALNDFVIRGCNSTRASKFYLEVDGEDVCDYIADGLIIATPTGSTAYGLSAGGPVLYPTIESISVVPICPHTLNARPLVVPACEKIAVKTMDGTLSVAIDGYNSCGGGGRVRE